MTRVFPERGNHQNMRTPRHEKTRAKLARALKRRVHINGSAEEHKTKSQNPAPRLNITEPTIDIILRRSLSRSETKLQAQPPVDRRRLHRILW